MPTNGTHSMATMYIIERRHYGGARGAPGSKGRSQKRRALHGARTTPGLAQGSLIGHYVYKTEDIPSIGIVFSRHYHCLEIRSLAFLA